MTVTLEQLQTEDLGRLALSLAPGDELVIMDGDRVINRYVAPPPGVRPGLGLFAGLLTIVSDDDDHLKDFAEYM